MASCGQHDRHRETVDAESALSVGDRSNNTFKRARWEKIATFDDQRVSMWGIAAGIDYIASPHAAHFVSREHQKRTPKPTSTKSTVCAGWYGA